MEACANMSSGIHPIIAYNMSAISRAPVVTMKPRRKAMPVVLMTPTTMPTAAQAAPTARAYPTPTWKLSNSSFILRRWVLCMRLRISNPTSRPPITGEKAPFDTRHRMKVIMAAGRIIVRGFLYVEKPTMMQNVNPMKAAMFGE